MNTQSLDGDGRAIPPDQLGRTIRALAEYSSENEDLVTVYIPPDKSSGDVIAYLRNEYDQCPFLPGKEECSGVKPSISTIIGRLKAYGPVPGHGLAVFCSPSYPAGEPGVCIIIEPPERIKNFLLRYSTRFEIEPLLAMSGEKNLYGLIVLDENLASWGLLDRGKIEPVGSITSNVPSKQKKGGQSARRFQRLHDNAVHEFCVRVGEHAGAGLLSMVGNADKIAGILIGGRGPAKDEFATGIFLPPEIRHGILGVIEIPGSDLKGLRDLATRGEEIIAGIRSDKEARLVREFMEELEKESGLAVYGEAAVRGHLAAGRVKTLLLSSSLRSSRAGITCTECGRGDVRSFRLEPGMRVQNILARTCRVCDAPIREDADVDVTEDLIRIGSRSGAGTVIISGESDDGKTFFARYGGIAALLRYRPGA